MRLAQRNRTHVGLHTHLCRQIQRPSPATRRYFPSLGVRDIVFRGKRSYGDFLRSEEGFSTNILAARLVRLEAEGIIAKKADPDDARKDIYTLTENGLDLIPVLFELVLWSAKHDRKSEARRISKLVELIRKDNRRISQKLIERVRAGGAVLPQYLD